jgi:hypothetical protein
VDQQLQHTSRKRQGKELLLKVKPQAILIAKITRNLIQVRVKNNILGDRLNATINNGASYMLRTIKKSDGIDFLFLLIIPSPAWPVYFVYRGKIKGFLKMPQKIGGSMKNTKDIRRKILTDYGWIKRVIESSETTEHLDSCKRIIENWSICTLKDLRECKCAFYKTKDFKKTIEAYRRSLSKLISGVADKRVNMLHSMD